MPRVLDIQRRHMELGRIRMGEKGNKGQPTRLETWRLTSASRDLLESAAGVYGGTVEEWTDAPDKGYYQLTTETAALDVMIPPGDAYSQYYELWTGGGCKRRCDGETELLTGLACKCDPDERECKITTRINVMLPQVAGLGVWRLESHGYYAAAELPDMLELLQQVSGGRIIGGILRIEQRSSKKDGRTNRYPVPVLDLPNITLASLTGGGVVVNPPLLAAGKPPLLTGAEMPTEVSFDVSYTPMGPPPALPGLKQPEQGERAPAREVATPATSPAPARPSLDQVKARLLAAAERHGIDTARLDVLIATQLPKGTSADNLYDALIALGTDIAAGKHDAAPGAAGDVPAEQMSDADALAAGAALVT